MSLFKSIFARGNAASEPCRTLSCSWKQMGPVWPPPCHALLRPTRDGHRPHAAAPAGDAVGTLPFGGMPPGMAPRAKACRHKVVGAGKSTCTSHPSPPHLRALPRASRAESTPEDRGLRVLLRQRGMRRRMLGWETRDAPLSHPSTFSANTALPRERPRFGTMLPGSAASARAREHPEPVGRCRAHRGKKLRPHSCESKPYRREGAVLPWRKGSS